MPHHRLVPAGEADVESAWIAGSILALPFGLDIMLEHKVRQSGSGFVTVGGSVNYVRERGIARVYIGAEDASRADLDFLVRLACAVRDAGAVRFRFADTLGILEPFAAYKKIKYLVDRVPGLEIEIHAHNDLGMATANTLAAVRGGALAVSTTVCGLGERAGNAPLEEVVMALKYLEGLKTSLDTCRFTELAGLVSRAAGRVLWPSKPIVGSHAFTHESGIHVDGLLKNPANYEFIDPLEVGQQSRLVVGKHSGSSGLTYLLEKMGIVLSPAEAAILLPIIRRKAVELTRDIGESELLEIYRDTAAEQAASRVLKWPLKPHPPEWDVQRQTSLAVFQIGPGYLLDALHPYSRCYDGRNSLAASRWRCYLKRFQSDHFAVMFASYSTSAPRYS
jgi:homocitrate synthase NifV